MLGLNEGEEKLKKFQGSFQCQEANKATVEMLLREQLLFLVLILPTHVTTPQQGYHLEA